MTTQTQPQIVEKKAFWVAGLRYEGRSERGEVPAPWDQFIVTKANRPTYDP